MMQPLTSSKSSKAGIAVTCGYFVGLRPGLDLAQRDAGLVRPRADHVDGPQLALAVIGMAGGLAVNGNHFAECQFGNALRPGDEAFRQLTGFEPRNYPCYAVVRGDAVLQRYPLAQPILLFLTKRFYGFPAFRPTNNRAYRQYNDVKQLVSLMSFYARVFQG